MTFAQDARAGTTMLEPAFAGVVGLRAQYREAGELLVYNAGEQGCGFAICLPVDCGA